MAGNGCCINDLRDKEVINICDGRKLGYVDDIEVDICNGRLVSIIVPCEGKLFGFGKGKDLIIMWERIEKIGDDTILVKVDSVEFHVKEEHLLDKSRKKRAFF